MATAPVVTAPPVPDDLYRVVLVRDDAMESLSDDLFGPLPGEMAHHA